MRVVSREMSVLVRLGCRPINVAHGFDAHIAISSAESKFLRTGCRQWLATRVEQLASSCSFHLSLAQRKPLKHKKNDDFAQHMGPHGGKNAGAILFGCQRINCFCK